MIEYINKDGRNDFVKKEDLVRQFIETKYYDVIKNGIVTSDESINEAIVDFLDIHVPGTLEQTAVAAAINHIRCSI